MQRTILTVAGLVMGLAITIVSAQDQKAKTLTTVGAVTKISGDSLSVDSGKGIVQLVTNTKTEVKVTGGGAKAQTAKQEGQKGVKITDAVHVGDQVSVKYTDNGGKLVAMEVDVLQRRPQNAQPVK
jgi:hypothetical protein